MKKYIIVLLLISGTVQAQQLSNMFIAPFDFPLYLSGNFGELRSNHFHAGLDFKTEGVEGKSVKCIADGYVSRIVVSGGGYGKALYVTHANGYTSVYGHLKAFVEPIASYVEEYQYKYETFTVDLCPESTRFMFKKGEQIALSGNTGHSFGPHLHMEIRETESGDIIDPFVFYEKRLMDTRPPLAKSVMFYPQPDKGIVNGDVSKQRFVVQNGSNTTHVFPQPIHAWGEIGVGLEAFDYMDGVSNVYGVRSVVLYVDSVEVFRSTVDRYSWEENRMINSWTDFAEYRQNKTWYMKSFIEPGNTLRMLRADNNRGIITVDKEKIYHFEYVLKDFAENTSIYKFMVKGEPQLISDKGYCGNRKLYWNKMNVIQQPGMHLIIPRGRLYDNVILNTKVYFDSTAISFEYCLSDFPVPLHKACDLLIGIKNEVIKDTSKYYISRRDKKHSYSVGGVYEDGWMRASIFELGTYRVEVDTIPPLVEPIRKAGWRQSGVISFRISDKQTGIKSYKGKINNQFVLFEFDAKSGRLQCKPTQKPIKKGEKLHLELAVEDNRGNITQFTDSFVW